MRPCRRPTTAGLRWMPQAAPARHSTAAAVPAVPVRFRSQWPRRGRLSRSGAGREARVQPTRCRARDRAAWVQPDPPPDRHHRLATGNSPRGLRPDPRSLPGSHGGWPSSRWGPQSRGSRSSALRTPGGGWPTRFPGAGAVGRGARLASRKRRVPRPIWPFRRGRIFLPASPGEVCRRCPAREGGPTNPPCQERPGPIESSMPPPLVSGWRNSRPHRPAAGSPFQKATLWKRLPAVDAAA